MAEIPKEDIALLIQHGENSREHEERVETTGKETVAYSYKTPESRFATTLRSLTRNSAAIKVCDPAVGSGAFPVGMMSEIVHARDVLKTWTKSQKTVHDLTASGLKTRSTAWILTRAQWRLPNCACGSR